MKDIVGILACIIAFAGVIIVFIGVILLGQNIYNNTNPTALDVYQGKTTLEITYRDSIPVDSVVVFKDEFKK